MPVTPAPALRMRPACPTVAEVAWPRLSVKPAKSSEPSVRTAKALALAARVLAPARLTTEAFVVAPLRAVAP